MWSPKLNMLTVVLLALAVLDESEGYAVSDRFFVTPRFQNFGNSIVLGESSEEESHDVVGFTNPIRIFVPRTSGRITRLIGQACESESQRLDPISLACYEIDTTGPCGPRSRMTFKEHPEDKMYGHCACDPSGYSNRPMVAVRGQCHFLYSQGICDHGHFLVLESSTMYGLESVCRPNPCVRNDKEDDHEAADELVPFEGHCVKLNAPSVLCPHKNGVVSFKRGHLKPVCTTGPEKTTRRRLFRRQITKTNELRCQTGYGKAKAGSTRCYRLLKISNS